MPQLLEQERKTLADIIGGIPNVPARLSPPAIVVMPGMPYVQPGSAYGYLTINWDASIIAGTATNEVSTDKLDNMIDDVVLKLTLSGYAFQVSDHKVYVANGAEYLAVDIGITKEIRMENDG